MVALFSALCACTQLPGKYEDKSPLKTQGIQMLQRGKPYKYLQARGCKQPSPRGSMCFFAMFIKIKISETSKSPEESTTHYCWREGAGKPFDENLCESDRLSLPGRRPGQAGSLRRGPRDAGRPCWSPLLATAPREGPSPWPLPTAP